MTMTSARTFTAPRGTRAANTDDPIVALRDVDRDFMRDVPDRATSSLGRGLCDIRLDVAEVSSVHCYFERRGSRLRVTNNSKNGTWFRGAALDHFELRPGEVFEVGGVTLLAMTEAMKAVEVDLRRLLGGKAHARVAHALELGATGAPAAIVGEAKAGHVHLAGLLHACSPRRPRRLEVVASLDDLRHLFGKASDLRTLGSICIDLFRCRRIRAQAPELARGLVELVRGNVIGTYVACEDAGQLHDELGFALGPERQIEIPPLRAHPDDLEGLLAHLLGADAMARLGDRNRRALLAHRWRDNFEGLRDACAKLRPILDCDGNLRLAARTTGGDHTSLSRFLRKLGLELGGAP